MSPALLIALRFLSARKRAMLMSLAGIVFGVAFFVVTQAQTAGFESYFIKTILGVNGMVRIEDRIQSTRSLAATQGSDFTIAVEGSVKYIPGVQYPNDLLGALKRFPEVTAASPVIRGNATLIANFREYDVKPYGIELASFVNVSDLDTQIIDGSLGAFSENPYGLILGVRIAKRMNLQIGDSVLLDAAGEPQRFRINAIYETGIDQVDRERVYLHLPAGRSLLNKPVGASFIQANVVAPELAPALAMRIEEAVGHSTLAWQEREKTWLQVFSVLRISSALTISTIIFISGLGMFNTLVMIVVDKTREIAILRSMGYTREDISRIFMLQGGIVVACGVVFGCLAAAAGTYALSHIPIRIRGIFASDHFVVLWDPWHYVGAAVIAVIVVMVASYFPSRRAARLEPGSIIRGSSS
ncbi:MAG: FtsX-like permease family protein [Verrucomicrobia bacterium]|nr:FtsX-like permease family protein [Verrucomicrobiota bacterium]